MFWSRLARHAEPEVDWRPATTDALKTLNPGLEQRDVTVGAQMARPTAPRATVQGSRAAQGPDDQPHAPGHRHRPPRS